MLGKVLDVPVVLIVSYNKGAEGASPVSCIKVIKYFQLLKALD